MTRNGFTPLRGSAEHGFTLIELLVAMVAGSLLLASLSWTLASLGRELAASRQAEPRRRLAASASMLANLIEQAVPPAQGQPAIVTEPRRFVFVTTPPAALGAVGPVRATLSVRTDAKGESLHARFEPADGAAAFPASIRADRPLIEHYRHIGFEYAKRAGKVSNLPPRLVTISLVDRKGRPARLSAAPRLTAGGDCDFDPVSMTCRR